MSWIDLAALTLTLWSGAKGYLHGAFHAFIHLLGLLASLGMAAILQKPLTAYLNGEWQAESHFVVWLGNNGDIFAPTGTSERVTIPPLVGTVMYRLVDGEQVLTVSSQEPTLAIISAMVIRFFALAAFFIFLAAGITFILRIKQYHARQENMEEWKRVLGLLFGLSYGLVLSLVMCVALDAISIMEVFLFLQHDLSISFLAKVTSLVLSLL